jgi:hypothetical protein
MGLNTNISKPKLDKDSSMIIEAKKINGIIIPKHEIHLECGHCGMEVDAVEYVSKTCNDCGQPWNEKRHVGIYVTSVPAQGATS